MTTPTTPHSVVSQGNIKIKFGSTTTSEIEVMLEASSDAGESIAKSILDKKKGQAFELTLDEAVYLRDNLYGDADRVAQGVSEAAGRAFEKAGEKLNELIKSHGN